MPEAPRRPLLDDEAVIADAYPEVVKPLDPWTRIDLKLRALRLELGR